MRVVLVSPWFRTLAQIYGRVLLEAGHEALVVTTGAHFEAGYGFVPEIRLPPRVKELAWLRQWTEARRRLSSWSPDVALVDQTWDMRLSMLPTGIPRAVLIHDAGPHDASHRGPAWQRAVIRHQRSAAPRLMCFSSSVARALEAETGKGATVLPLTSEMPQELVSDLVPAQRRRDFLVLGRVSAYKNLDTVFRAWTEYVRHPGYQGDELVLVGEGELDTSLPARCRWQRGRFGFADVVQGLHAYKASIVMYEAASQSGAQLTSMQVGVSPIASTAGGLPEYQPEFRPCLDPRDVRGLLESLLELTDGQRAAREGDWARQHYDSNYRDRVAGAKLVRASEELLLL